MPATSDRNEAYLQLDDGWLFYLQQGEGFPLLVLHAAGSSSWTWRRVMDGLAGYFAVYVPDLPGFDRSETPTRDFDIDDFTGAMIEFMNRAGLDRAHVIGNLTGGMVALDMAVRFPERVAKLVLVSCPGWTTEEGKIVYERFFVPWYDERGLPRQRSFAEDSQRYGNADQELTDFHNSIIARNGRWFARVHEVNSSWDVSARLGSVSAPTLLVYGDRCDQVRREQRLLEGIRGSRSVHIPGAASHSYYEQPGAFLASVLPFLTETAASARPSLPT